MKVIYSFVVDATPCFLPQTRMFLASLMAQGVVPHQIHAHVTPEVGEEARALLRKIGVCSHELRPFLDGKYCNKLVQLGSVDKGDSQKGQYLIQGSFWGGYLDPGFDE